MEAILKLFLTIVAALSIGGIASTLKGGDAEPKAHAVTRLQATLPQKVLPQDSELPTMEISSPLPMQPIAPPTSTSAQDVAQFCDSIDLVSHPEHASKMVKVASAAYGTPSGLLNGIWHTESHHGINGQTGTARVMDQFTIRDCWKPGYTTHRPNGCTSPYIFVGEIPSETRWKALPKKRRVGNGTVQKQSIIRIAKALGISPWSIKGSRGNRILTGLKNPSKPGTHGGCFGNMQITPSEWEADVLAMGYKLSELTPFNVCDSLLVSSFRLKKHHDQRLRKYMKDAYWKKRKEEANQLSWLWSGRRYYGGPDRSSSNKYEYHFKHGRKSASFSCGWKCWDKMEQSKDFSLLTSYIHKRGSKLRRNRN